MKKQKRTAYGAVVAATSMLLIPAVTSAQGMMVAARSSQRGNSCLQLKSTPSTLVSSPEGLELRKMQQELMEVRSRADSLDPTAIQKVTMVRKGVDSLVQVFVRGAPGEFSGSSTVIFRTSPGVEPTSAADRAMFEMMIREMQPRVAALRAGTVTINMQSTARGYLGLTTSMDTYPTMPDLNRPFAYCEYPRVETVEPGSPAEKVGLTSGDTLLAYNGRDLLAFDVHYPALLVPGRQLRISFRRDGQIREVAPTVSQRAAGERVFVVAGRECGEPGTPFACEATAPAMAGPRMPAAGPTTVRSSIMGRPAPAPMFFPILMPSNVVPTEATLGGARLMVISEAFQKSQGLVPGLLVLDASESLQAYAAGIRKGDVIVSANGNPVRDVNSLANAMAPTMREHYATLQLSSSTGLRTVTIRW